MRVIESALALVLALTASHASATFVPTSEDVVGATLDGQGGDYGEGYVELNRTQGTISLVLQPVMPACAEDVCIAVMPRQQDYFFTKISRVDECGAVIYSAQQSDDRLTKVTVIDNTDYDYGQCPTFLPKPASEVKVEQTSLNGDPSDRTHESLVGSPLTAVTY